MRGLGAFILLLACLPVDARVFNYKDSGLAAYIRGTGGLSEVGQEPFANSSGVDTSVNEETRFNYSGEIGALFGFSESFQMRLGLEVIQHRPISEAKGVDSSGSERFSLDSSVFVFNPEVTFEYIFNAGGATRFFAAAGVGMADVTVENRYTMTTQGSADLGVQSFNEKMEAQTTSAHVALGVETLFLDNVTVALEAGYRYLPVGAMKYKGDVNNIVSPTGASKGQTVKNHDGTTRKMDLGGLFTGISFRFYLNFL